MKALIHFGEGPGGPGVMVSAPGRAALLSELEALMGAGRGFTLATLNLDHLVKLGRDGAFRAAYGAHSHVVADGNPVVWLYRLAGRTVDLVPGSELVEPLAGAAARAGVPVALVGSTQPALEGAARALEAAHPGIEVAMRLAPPMGFDPVGAHAGTIVEALAARPSGLCLLALGAPKQERFAIHAAARLPGWGFASVGAGVDFVAGTQRRAPAWVRAATMEWVWRLGSSPRRLGGRYAACAVILPRLALQAVRARP